MHYKWVAPLALIYGGAWANTIGRGPLALYRHDIMERMFSYGRAELYMAYLVSAVLPILVFIIRKARKSPYGFPYLVHCACAVVVSAAIYFDKIPRSH